MVIILFQYSRLVIGYSQSIISQTIIHSFREVGKENQKFLKHQNDGCFYNYRNEPFSCSLISPLSMPLFAFILVILISLAALFTLVSAQQ